jgi:hypothetical protein
MWQEFLREIQLALISKGLRTLSAKMGRVMELESDSIMLENNLSEYQSLFHYK